MNLCIGLLNHQLTRIINWPIRLDIIVHQVRSWEFQSVGSLLWNSAKLANYIGYFMGSYNLRTSKSLTLTAPMYMLARLLKWHCTIIVSTLLHPTYIGKTNYDFKEHIFLKGWQPLFDMHGLSILITQKDCGKLPNEFKVLWWVKSLYGNIWYKPNA